VNPSSTISHFSFKSTDWLDAVNVSRIHCILSPSDWHYTIGLYRERPFTVQLSNKIATYRLMCDGMFLYNERVIKLHSDKWVF